jgi:hydroxyacylglutathione hydrolase
MLLKHFFVEKIAHSSYMLAGGSSCAIVDPARDPYMYIRAAEQAGLAIDMILLTHLHADFIAGHIDLAGLTGAKIIAPSSARCLFPHRGVAEGDSFQLEHIRIDVLETPGHTPEHVSYVVTDTARGEAPVGVFCGDTLFVGDAGRPDLFPGRAEELASRLFDSLQLLIGLPDFCEVYPAHGAGSLCGRAVGARYTSTMGYERRFNRVLNLDGREALVKDLTENMPPAPDHFRRCSEINRKGPVPLCEIPPPRSCTPKEFHELAQRPGTVVVDARACDAFSAQHIPGSISISTLGNFPTFAGWVLDPEALLLLVCDTPAHAEETVKAARMVSENAVVGYLPGGLFGWAMAGLPSTGFRHLFPLELKELLRSGDPVQLVDVRAPGEYARGTIEGAVNIPAPSLRTRFSELDSRMETILFCSSGHRSSLAASLLERRGFASLMHLAGGMAAWKACCGG